MSRTLYPEGHLVLREVGLRDGLQMVKQFPTTAAKQDWIAREHTSGVRHFELGSFLPAGRFPQFADLAEILQSTAALESAATAALALNERGLEAALASPVDEIMCVVSATEAHSQANMRRSRADAVALIAQAKSQAGPDGPAVTGAISMGFGCSIAGPVAEAEVLDLALACRAAGADMIALADTVGFAGPAQVTALFSQLIRALPDVPIGAHFHDTRGLGLANAAAALDSGVRILDASLGGLGGCPFAPGATGNIVFEDLVFLCERMGFATGINLDALRDLRRDVETGMGGELFHGKLATAGPPTLIDWRAGTSTQHGRH